MTVKEQEGIECLVLCRSGNTAMKSKVYALPIHEIKMGIKLGDTFG